MSAVASKSKTSFRCRNCSHQEPKWLGRCPSCGAWNTLEEEQAGPKEKSKQVRDRTVPGPGGRASFLRPVAGFLAAELRQIICRT